MGVQTSLRFGFHALSLSCAHAVLPPAGPSARGATERAWGSSICNSLTRLSLSASVTDRKTKLQTQMEQHKTGSNPALLQEEGPEKMPVFFAEVWNAFPRDPGGQRSHWLPDQGPSRPGVTFIPASLGTEVGSQEGGAGTRQGPRVAASGAGPSSDGLTAVRFLPAAEPGAARGHLGPRCKSLHANCQGKETRLSLFRTKAPWRI